VSLKSAASSTNLWLQEAERSSRLCSRLRSFYRIDLRLKLDHHSQLEFRLELRHLAISANHDSRLEFDHLRRLKFGLSCKSCRLALLG
jgi:hypothetical protein